MVRAQRENSFRWTCVNSEFFPRNMNFNSVPLAMTYVLLSYSIFPLRIRQEALMSIYFSSAQSVHFVRHCPATFRKHHANPSVFPLVYRFGVYRVCVFPHPKCQKKIIAERLPFRVFFLFRFPSLHSRPCILFTVFRFFRGN